jgi:hypothetical protein
VGFQITFDDSKYDSLATNRNPSPKNMIKNHNTQNHMQRKLA